MTNTTTIITNALYAAQSAAIAKEAAQDTNNPADIQIAEEALYEYHKYSEDLIDIDLNAELCDAFIIANKAIEDANPQAIDVALDLAGIKPRLCVQQSTNLKNKPL